MVNELSRDAFNKHGAIYVKDVLNKSLCNFLTHFLLREEAELNLNKVRGKKELKFEEGRGDHVWNDPQVPTAVAVGGSPVFDTVNEMIWPFLEEIIGEELIPTYSYGRIYWKGSELKRHTDRNSSEVTASCCLKKDVDWSLNYDFNNEIISANLDVGDISISHGSKIPHWREKYSGKEHIQAFVQYVYADGEYNHLIYDTRPCLAAPYEMVSDEVKREFQNQYK